MATIEKLEGPLVRWRLSEGNTFVEVVPARGGLVSAYQVDGVPVLYLDEQTLLDPTRSVRGGVPLLFPRAGKPPPGSKLAQHGFLRGMPFEVTAAVADDATARLECWVGSTPDTLAVWPYPFEARLAVSLFDSRLMMEFAFTNLGDEPMPLHFGLHPYFAVADKQQVRVEGAVGPAFDNTRGTQREVGPVDFSEGEVDLHFTPFEAEGTTLERGDGRRVKLAWTSHFRTLVVWTLPGKPYVCVEPWPAAGQAPARQFVPPEATELLAFEVSLGDVI